jgi:hypothetical protein
MFGLIFDILLLLFLKHLIVDFFLQTDAMIQQKSQYGQPLGILHSFLHGVGTSTVFVHWMDWETAVWLGVIDMILHYHIDWLKMRFKHPITDRRFWWAFGIDQFLHQFTYIVLVFWFFAFY